MFRFIFTIIKLVVITVVIATAFSITQPALAGSSLPPAVYKAIDYLHAHQSGDGGFFEEREKSSEFITCYAIIAISAIGEDPKSWKKKGKSPVDFLKNQKDKWRNLTDFERVVLAITASGEDPKNFNGVNVLKRVRQELRQDGSIGGMVNSTCWGVFALKSSGEKISSKTLKFLKDSQNSDGGWGWSPGGQSDTNDTAVAIQAVRLLGMKSNSKIIKKSLSFLSSLQNADGGFSFYKFGSDCASDAWVLQALASLSTAAGSLKKNSRSPLDHIVSLQKEDGRFLYQDGLDKNPVWMTCQALPGILGKPFPVKEGEKSVSRYVPVIKNLFPIEGGTTNSGEVFVSYGDGYGTGIDQSGVRLVIDGKDVTKSSKFSDGQIEANLPLGSGKHSANLVLIDKSGNRASKSWEFERIDYHVEKAVSSSKNNVKSSQPEIPMRVDNSASVSREVKLEKDNHSSSKKEARTGKTGKGKSGLNFSILIALCAVALLVAGTNKKFRKKFL